MGAYGADCRAPGSIKEDGRVPCTKYRPNPAHSTPEAHEVPYRRPAEVAQRQVVAEPTDMSMVPCIGTYTVMPQVTGCEEIVTPVGANSRAIGEEEP